MQRMLTTCLLIALASINSAGIVHSQDLPISALTSYDEFRKALQKYGWRPDTQYGSSTYGYNGEVMCGNSMCTAQWSAENGTKINFTLWWDSSGEYRIAPQID